MSRLSSLDKTIVISTIVASSTAFITYHTLDESKTMETAAGTFIFSILIIGFLYLLFDD